MKVFKKNISYLILFCMILIQSTSWSQLENANWYFGDHAGLNFENSTPTVLTDGQTPSNFSRTASISDSDGEILFYTDGHFVWNQNGNIMTGSSDSFPKQGIGGVVITPYPNNNGKYIIFTSVNQSSVYKNYFTVVNMQSGLGNVELLNNLTNLPFSDYSDSLVVAKHSNNSSYWLISVTNENTISCLLINQTGPTNTVITSPTTITPNSLSGGGLSLKISPDNSKLAFGDWLSGFTENIPLLYIYNFDDSSGLLTVFYIEDEQTQNGELRTTIQVISSVEFSSDSNLIYILGINQVGSFNIYAQYILQMDLNNIENSGVTFSESYNGVQGSNQFVDANNLMRALDGKIYIPNYNSFNSENLKFLSVINNPNIIGTGNNFVENQINLLSGKTYRLPYLALKHESNCALDLNITQNVNSGQTDIQEAQNTITATNTIFNGAAAEYDAGDSVTLALGFNAKTGSEFKAFIDGCQTNSPTLPSFFNNETILTKVNDENLLRVFPNPSKNSITIELDEQFDAFEIFDAKNQNLILAKKNQDKSNLVNISNFKKGLYLIKVFTKNKILYSKFVKN